MDLLEELDRAKVAEILADPHARMVIAATIAQARSPKDLLESTQIPHATLYRVLHRLEETKLLIKERSAMTADGKPYDLWRSTIRVVTVTYDDQGMRVAVELNEGAAEKWARMWSTLKGL